MDIEKAIENWINVHKEQYIRDVQEICSVPSVSKKSEAQPGEPFGHECRLALDWILRKAKSMGFEVNDYDGYFGDARYGSKKESIGILGHLDVVPAGDNWIYPPFGRTRIGDFLIGRGVSDDKGPALAGLYAAYCIKDLGLPMKNGIQIWFGCSEETGMDDLQYYLQMHKPSRVSIVPDCGFPVCIAQKGTLRADFSIDAGSSVISFSAGLAANMVPAKASAVLNMSVADFVALSCSDLVPKEIEIGETPESKCVVTAKGIPAHAADPSRGKNAINILSHFLAYLGLPDERSDKAMKAIDELTCDCHGKSCGISCEDPISGKTTTNFGLAELVDGQIIINMDARLSVKQDPDTVEQCCIDTVSKLGFGYKSVSKTRPFYVDKDSSPVRILTNVYRQITGRDDQPYAMGGGTYSRYLSTAYSYGPGFPEDDFRPDIPQTHGGAHNADEFVYIPSLLKAMKIYVMALLSLDAELV